MEICGHNIDDTEIIGIGPLMIHRSTDLTILQLYGTISMYFELHCRSRSISIKSDSFDTIGHNPDFLKSQNQIREKFTEQYKEDKKNLLLQLSNNKA